MSIHESKRHTLLASSPEGARKIFSVSFQKRDGSIYVYFPYHSSSEGVIGVAGGVEIEDGRFAYDSFVPAAKTSHHLKFAYHPDGRTHFSQTGRVLTSLVRHVAPLAEACGPIFYVTARGLAGFPLATAQERHANEANKGLFEAHFDEPVSGVSFTGFLKPRQELLPGPDSTSGSPLRTLLLPDGQTVPALAIGSPYSSDHHDRVLAITVEPLPLSNSGPRESSLIFCGPIKPDSDSDGGRRTCQTALYPRALGGSDLEDIPSIDLSELECA